jgi:hypothetical protein
VQTLFDRLSIIYPCAWQDNSIVVLDEYVIDPPYTTIVVKPGRDGSGIDRLSKIVSAQLLLHAVICGDVLRNFFQLEGERRKLKLEG